MGRLVFDIFLCFLAFTLIPVIIFRYVDPPTTAEIGLYSDRKLQVEIVLVPEVGAIPEPY